jgi:hypothetical protein
MFLYRAPTWRIIVAEDTFRIVPVRAPASAKKADHFEIGNLGVDVVGTFRENGQPHVAWRIRVGYDEL